MARTSGTSTTYTRTPVFFAFGKGGRFLLASHQIAAELVHAKRKAFGQLFVAQPHRRPLSHPARAKRRRARYRHAARGPPTIFKS
jgi:hypothetical protein